jgi:ADP-heptose:LPS heptosyltransferase
LTSILVIKFGAFGDMVQALGPFAAIRKHHSDAQITLLTTPPFAEFAKMTGLFDQVRSDGRRKLLPRLPDIWPLGSWALAADLAKSGFSRVYDLQTSRRSSLLFRLWPGRKPEWSGIARGASHPHRNPHRNFMHTIERQWDQLADAGLLEHVAPDLSFAAANPQSFGIQGPYALIAPGGAGHRPDKRWPLDRFIGIAKHIAAHDLTPVIIGHGREEQAMAARMIQDVPKAQSLVGQTSLCDLAGLMRQTKFAIGNDSGPMHLASAAGIPCLVLFGPASDPALCAPRGAKVQVLRAIPMTHLTIEQVIAGLDSALNWQI